MYVVVEKSQAYMWHWNLDTDTRCLLTAIFYDEYGVHVSELEVFWHIKFIPPPVSDFRNPLTELDVEGGYRFKTQHQK